MKKLKKALGEAGVLKLPSISLSPKIISRKEAEAELSKYLGDQLTYSFIEAAGIPDRMKFAKTRNGIEFYDTESKRPTTTYDFAQIEEPKDVGEWLKGWYFAILRKGEKTIARLYDRGRTLSDGSPMKADVVIMDSDKERPATPHNFTVEIDTMMTLY